VQIGTIEGAAIMGALTGSLASYSGANPDTADTLAVNLAESGGVLVTVTSLDAQLGNTLCIVDSELLSYTTATLTSAGKYALTGLYRGLYGAAAALHSSGANFAFLAGNGILKYALPAPYVGVELYIKLQSFNVFGGGMQNLSNCTAYTYTPSGAAFDHPAAEAMLTATVLDFGSVTTAPGVDDDFGTPFTLSIEDFIDLGAA
jgi:hypothetical protein